MTPITESSLIKEYVQEKTAFTLIKCGTRLADINPALYDNRRVVEAALRRNGGDLQHASDRLRDIKAVVRLALESDPTALQFASARVKNSVGTVLVAVKRANSEQVLEVLESAGEKPRNNDLIAMIAVVKDLQALQYIGQAPHADVRFGILIDTLVSKLESSNP